MTYHGDVSESMVEFMLNYMRDRRRGWDFDGIRTTTERKWVREDWGW